MQKCLGCQFYDRRNASTNDGKGTLWGQCRRTAPLLHPLNAKTYMVEGVWPHVRDDDWCGEWKAGVRRPEGRPADLMMGSPAQQPALAAAPRVTAITKPMPAAIAAPAPQPGVLGRIGSD